MRKCKYISVSLPKSDWQTKNCNAHWNVFERGGGIGGGAFEVYALLVLIQVKKRWIGKSILKFHHEKVLYHVFFISGCSFLLHKNIRLPTLLH